jgi:ADP-heptose:LPS heptosyltransferase
MQILRGLEEWGRKRTLAVFAKGITTQETTAHLAGQSLKENPSAQILLIGIYQHMGQFLCATPLIRALKASWPNASLHFLGNPVNASAALANPHLDRIWVWRKNAFWEWFGQLRALRKNRFDLALLLTTERPSATGVLLARATGARWVAAYVPSVSGTWAQDATVLCHIRIPFEGEKNEVEKYLGFARAFSVPVHDRRPELVLSPPDEAAAESFFTGQNLSTKSLRVGLFIGGKAERTDRLWPIPHFTRLADSLKAAGFQVVAVSPPAPSHTSSNAFRPEEHLRLEEFQRALLWSCPVFQEAQLGRVAAFLRKLDLLVCPDGGILHLAAAVGTPTLGLFFSTDPDVWRHYMRQTFLDGRGRSSSELSPETVANEVMRFLGVTAPK